MSSEKSPSSSLPTIEYRSKPLKFRWTPSPKSSFVHCMRPVLSITRHGRVTREPTMAVWSCGSMANLWCCLSWLPLPLLLMWTFAFVACGIKAMMPLTSIISRKLKCLLIRFIVMLLELCCCCYNYCSCAWTKEGRNWRPTVFLIKEI